MEQETVLQPADIVYVRFVDEDTEQFEWYEGKVLSVVIGYDENGKYFSCIIHYTNEEDTEERKLWIEDYGHAYEGSWMTKQKSDPLAPLFNWLGGKRNELSSILKHVPKSFTNYVEPFVGGGAILFHLRPFSF